MALLKLIACEVALRELCHAASRSRNLVDLEFLTQGYHDVPATGRCELQKRIEAVPAGKYEAVLLGYGLCSSILSGIRAGHTPLVIPRAHDCITLFLGARKRYQQLFEANPATYYYTSGWLECAKRRGLTGSAWNAGLAQTGAEPQADATYAQWVAKYGEEEAKYLREEMSRWTASYTQGTLIQFDFTQHLNLGDEVRRICEEKGWAYSEAAGDMRLFQNLLDGVWPESDFLMVPPGGVVEASYDEGVVRLSGGMV
jgi:hypothetical protein